MFKTEANNKHLIVASCWFFYLHTLLTMHGQRNLKSCMMLPSHLYLGLPLGLVVKGFHLNIFLVALASGVLRMWPNQLSVWVLMQLTVFSCFISLSNSSLFSILHVWTSFVGPNIPLKIFLSKTSSFWSMISNIIASKCLESKLLTVSKDKNFTERPV